MTNVAVDSTRDVSRTGSFGANVWSDSLLDELRQTGDPLADGVIAKLFADSEADQVNALMRTLITNEFIEPEAFPPAVHEYLELIDRLPEWADPNLIATGERLFEEHGPKPMLLLLFYSLPFDYLDHKGAQVLALTTRMLSNPARRTAEVLQFLMDIMQRGGLTVGEGRGRRSIQKARLMHASVRRLAAASPSWKQEWNLPVNQEDLLLTLTSFSWVVLDGLEKLGVTISQADQEANLHCWL